MNMSVGVIENFFTVFREAKGVLFDTYMPQYTYMLTYVYT